MKFDACELNALVLTPSFELRVAERDGGYATIVIGNFASGCSGVVVAKYMEGPVHTVA